MMSKSFPKSVLLSFSIHHFLYRIRYWVTVNGGKIIDETKAASVIGSMTVTIPRNSQKNQPEREATLDVRTKTFDVKKPNWRRNDKHLSESVRIAVIYISESQSPEGIEPIKWLLSTNENVTNTGDAIKIAEYYIQRWKIERFRYVMKSGCQIEKISRRSVDKIITLILMIRLFQ